MFYSSLWSKAETVGRFVKRAKGGDHNEAQSMLLELYGQGQALRGTWKYFLLFAYSNPKEQQKS